MNITKKASIVITLLGILIAVNAFGDDIPSQKPGEGITVRLRRLIRPAKENVPEIRQNL